MDPLSFEIPKIDVALQKQHAKIVYEAVAAYIRKAEKPFTYDEICDELEARFPFIEDLEEGKLFPGFLFHPFISDEIEGAAASIRPEDCDVEIGRNTAKISFSELSLNCYKDSSGISLAKKVKEVFSEDKHGFDSGIYTQLQDAFIDKPGLLENPIPKILSRLDYNER